MKLIKISLLLAYIAIGISANAQVVYFNGLGRALITNDRLSGNAIDTNTTDPRRGTGGYTLFDLGINVQPNELLRGSVTLRIRNEFGGFYGDGTTINFRQLKLDGIIGKVVKYEIGDLDLMLTPYTLYNFNESYYDYESDIFSIRRSIVHYENFNFGNKWRVQGAHAETKLKFEKGIERISLRAFATRSKRIDFSTLKNPDRLLVGAKVDVLQSKYFNTGFNYINVFDVVGTIPDTSVKLNNQVLTQDLKINIGGDKIGVQVYGEYGFSFYENKRSTEVSAFKKDDYFFDIGSSINFKPKNIKAYVSYRNVGADFFSPGAQTRRIYDRGNPSLFPLIGQARQPILFDRFSDENLMNPGILDTLIGFDPKYNNISPYGTATPNRKGFTIGISAGDADKLYRAEIISDLLSEIVGEGNQDLREFIGLRGGVLLNGHKLFQWNKMLVPTIGFRLEKTSREAKDPAMSSNNINLNSILVDAGLTIEIVKQVDIILGYKSLRAKGKEIYALRDEYNNLDMGNVLIFNYDNVESIIAAGPRYRFSKNTFITGQWFIVNASNKADSSKSYKMNQLFLNYTMIF